MAGVGVGVGWDMSGHRVDITRRCCDYTIVVKIDSIRSITYAVKIIFCVFPYRDEIWSANSDRFDNQCFRPSISIVRHLAYHYNLIADGIDYSPPPLPQRLMTRGKDVWMDVPWVYIRMIAVHRIYCSPQ